MVKKVAIIAGGRGARLLEETRCHPKPMCLIGEEPILTHIMRHYSNYGFTEFVVAIGYLGERTFQMMKMKFQFLRDCKKSGKPVLRKAHFLIF